MFIRAKSEENKKIRMQEIMDYADHLFKTHNYHEITLSMISNEIGIGRTGLYKYVSSKEEIFLNIILEKQKKVMDEIVAELKDKEATLHDFAQVTTEVLYNHIDLIKYFQILTTILETNASLDTLINFKTKCFLDSQEFYSVIKSITHFSDEKTFNFHLSILHHATFLSDVAFPNKTYYEVMQAANLPAAKIDFKKELIHFIEIMGTHY